MIITVVPLTDGKLWLSAYTEDDRLMSYVYEDYKVEEAKEDFLKILLQYNLQQRKG